MQFCGCCGRSLLSCNSDVLVTSTLAGMCAKKKTELRYFLRGNETDVGLMDPLELSSYLFILVFIKGFILPPVSVLIFSPQRQQSLMFIWQLLNALPHTWY